MKFAGQLQLTSEPDDPVAVRLNVHDGQLSIAADSSEIGSWPLDQVTASQTGSSRFRLDIQGEAADFVADDPVLFSGEGMRLINGTAEPGMVGRLWSYLTEPDELSAQLESFAVGHASVSVVDPPTDPGVLIDLVQNLEQWEFSAAVLETLFETCGETLDQVRSGVLRPEIGIAVARLARSMCAVLDSARGSEPRQAELTESGRETYS